MESKNLKNIILRGAALLIFLNVCFSQAKGQGAFELRINELLVVNDSNYIDDFGQHSPWIEIFNGDYNSVNIGGMFLTDDLSNPKKYWIPKGDPMTNISPRGYIVFFADNHPTRGILHLNFRLAESKTIALFSSNGETLIDSITINLPQRSDVSYGRLADGGSEWGFVEKTTPNANNNSNPKVTAGEEFVKMDPSGLGMTFIAMFVVFLSLALLYIIYKQMGRYFIRRTTKKKPTAEQKESKEESDDEGISGELNAAIAMALHLYQNELHDLENTVLTIQKTSRNYSPWSSKIYTIRKYPNN
jgi:Na+-transporting methylmalonyl-CoA/oxaloacetate decarboxylase gamma subunit